MAYNCENCRFRAYHDRKSTSLLGRLWRWHINFCPEWKAYFTSLPGEEKQRIREMYNFNKYQTP